MVESTAKGFRSITPSLSVDGAERAIELYKNAFGATLDGKIMRGPDGKVMHAVIHIGDSKIMLADPMPNCPVGPTHSGFYLYMADADAAFKKATQAGLKSQMEPEDMFWGDRMGVVTDPWGNGWTIAQHVKDMSDDEITRAGQEWMRKMGHEAV